MSSLPIMSLTSWVKWDGQWILPWRIRLYVIVRFSSKNGGYPAHISKMRMPNDLRGKGCKCQGKRRRA